jgi:hypothetical protein
MLLRCFPKPAEISLKLNNRTIATLKKTPDGKNEVIYFDDGLHGFG